MTKKTITTEVFTFDLLSDKAKEKARNWYRESAYDDYTFASDHIKEDAMTIGLQINGWDCDSASFIRNMEGEFVDGAFNCANKIIAEHGEDCATHKDAKAFLEQWDALPDTNTPDARVDDADAIEGEFLGAMLKSYSRMLQDEYEFVDSDEHIDENIIANEYTFTEDGKRFG